MTPRSVVIGGGISGLAGARVLAQAGHKVVVLESDDRLGGKIRTTEFCGRPVDEGADAFLARVPHALELCHKLGLGDDLVSPATGSASLWFGRELRPIPTGLLLGVPVDFGPLTRSRVLSPIGLARAALEPWLPGRPVTDDVTIGDLVRRRYGREVHERLVDPLLGGINAGRTEELSLDVGAAQLAAVARKSRSLTVGLRRSRAENPPNPNAPVFYAPRQGMSSLVGGLAKALTNSADEVRTSTTVTNIERGISGGYRLVTSSGGVIDADRVLVTAPAGIAADLLERLSTSAAALLAQVRYASVVLVTLAFRNEDLTRPIEGSGFLVPRRERRLLTACSVFSNKWPQLADPEITILRASVGRFRDERAIALDDDTLLERVLAELDEVFGLSGPPVATRITRWPNSFPQFAAGHLDMVAEVEKSLATDVPGVALAGAYMRGVGIPACIGGATTAAARLVTG